MTTTKTEEKSPADLMKPFKGSSLKSIIIFTVVVHIIVLGATSGSYFFKSGAKDKSKLSEEQRMKEAVSEATASLSKIAEKYGLKAQDLSSRFTDGSPKAPKAAPETAETPTEVKPADPEKPENPEKPKSEIEKEIEKTAPGPVVPSVQDEDLFK